MKETNIELKLTKEETLEIKESIFNFYKNLNTIQKYFLERKKEKINGIHSEKYIPDLFSDYEMEPKDMEFEFSLVEGSYFNPIVQVISSLPLESQIGRQIMLGLKEKKTQKWVGFVRVASPVLTIKPRNDFFDKVVQAKSVNKNMINGAVIVPVQPFGYNYLGGKLLTLLSCSHEVRNLLKEKYGEKIEPCFFETTSLYGDLKGVSQYDGMKPFIKYQSMTESDLFLFPTEEVYEPIRKKMRSLYGREEWGGSVVDPVPSGPKMREFSKIISIIKNHLKFYDEKEYKEFNDFTKTHMKSKTKKRYYYSDFGFSNVKEHVNSDGEITLIEGQNFHKHNLEYMFEWWRNKAQRRYESLKERNMVRKGLEIYTLDSINNNLIEMVR